MIIHLLHQDITSLLDMKDMYYEGVYSLWSEKCFEEQLSKYFEAFETYDECIEFMNTRVRWINANSIVSDGKLIITYHYSDDYNYDKEYTIVYEK